MKNIYLVGFMGTGKSTVGKILSQRLNKEFVEMDEVIEAREGKPITEIFASSGEPYFRILEKNLLKEIALKSDTIVSCGGGLVCNQENLDILKASGLVLNLTASPEVIYQRIKEFTNRPILNVKEPLVKIQELFKQRQPFYNKAHLSLDTEVKSPEVIALEIEKIISKIKV